MPTWLPTLELRLLSPNGSEKRAVLDPPKGARGRLAFGSARVLVGARGRRSLALVRALSEWLSLFRPTKSIAIHVVSSVSSCTIISNYIPYFLC